MKKRKGGNSTKGLRFGKLIPIIVIIVAAFFAITSAAGGGNGSGKAPDDLLTVKVVRVVDGDTIIVDMGGDNERVRFIGVDTPESVHPDKSKNVPYGQVASDYTKGMLDGKKVGLEFDVEERDRYGRILAYVYLDGVMFNKTLLDEGHAVVATYPPNVKYVDIFTEAQKQARAAGKGLWAEGAE